MLVKSNAVDIIVIDSVRHWCHGPRSKANRRFAHGFAGALDEPGTPHSQSDDFADPDVHDLHQPDSPEDRRHVRQPETTPAVWR